MADSPAAGLQSIVWANRYKSSPTDIALLPKLKKPQSGQEFSSTTNGKLYWCFTFLIIVTKIPKILSTMNMPQTEESGYMIH